MGLPEVNPDAPKAGSHTNDSGYHTTTSSQLEFSSPARYSFATGNFVKTDDTNPWYRQMVLSFDGGGVRGYSQLLILQAIMARVALLEGHVQPAAIRSLDSPQTNSTQIDSNPSSEKFLPCHYFDYIGGTSTGGLIAILLGRLRMTVEAAVVQYLRICEMLWGRSWTRIPSFLGQGNKSKRETLGSLVQRISPSLSGEDESKTRFRSDVDRCKTIVCSIRGSSDGRGDMIPFLFRSYGEPPTPFGALESLSDVARATVATSSYFEPLRVGKYNFLDAATGLNNPCLAILSEISHVHSQLSDPVSFFLSLGCGTDDRGGLNISSGSRTWKARETNRNIESRIDLMAEGAHLEMLRRSREVSQDEFSYYRFDVKGGLGNIASHEWKEKSSGEPATVRIGHETRRYLEQPDIMKDIEQCAKLLVERRRRRANTVRWEGFALGTRYRCKVENCDYRLPGGKPFPDRNALMDHFIKHHNMAPPNSENIEHIKMLVSQGRTNSK